MYVTPYIGGNESQISWNTDLEAGYRTAETDSEKKVNPKTRIKTFRIFAFLP